MMIEKAVEPESQGNTCYSWCTRNGHQEPGKGNGRTGYQWENRNHPDCNMFEIGKNTEDGTGELGRLAVTQTPVKDPQITIFTQPLRSDRIWHKVNF